jgi:hypothetical protein
LKNSASTTMKQRGLTLVFIAVLGALLHTAAVDGEF